MNIWVNKDAVLLSLGRYSKSHRQSLEKLPVRPRVLQLAWSMTILAQGFCEMNFFEGVPLGYFGSLFQKGKRSALEEEEVYLCNPPSCKHRNLPSLSSPF